RTHARESGGGGGYGFQLNESAHALGIDFVHETPSSFDPKLEKLTPWFQAMAAASAAVCDVNGDGWPDLYVTNARVGSKNRLYINDAIWWDFNRDGCLDIYAGAYWRSDHNFWHLDDTRIMQSDFNWARNGGRNKLYQQVATAGRCTGTFPDVSRQLGLDDSG